MPEQALYLKWRPLHFDDVIGQNHITRTLQGALRQGRIRHAYLFSGPRGTGKTTTARLLAKAVNCQHEDPAHHPCNECAHCVAVNEGRYLDLIEIDAASHTGVDDVRELRDKIAFSPGEGQYKVYIIDEVHRFSGAAFDALLKTLEEPPEHAIFVLATTELEKVPDTILSRCLPFEFRRVTVAELTNHLVKIVEGEGFSIERAALELIARQGTGSVRDSISLLDQVIADPDEHITLAMAEQALGAAGRRAVGSLVNAMLVDDTPGALQIIHQAIDGGADPRQFARQTVDHLRNVLLTQTAGAAIVDDTEEARQVYAQQAGMIQRPPLLRMIRSFNDATQDRSSDWQPQLPLELALMESLTPDQQEQVVVQRVVQQVVSAPSSGAAPDTPEPEPEASAPGEPPVIGVISARDKWDDVKKAAYQINKNVPAILDHFTIRSVEGNTLVLTAKNAIFKEKLGSDDRRRALLRALKYVYKQPMLFRVEVLSEAEAQSAAHSQSQLSNDELIAYSVAELGGEVTDIKATPGVEEESDNE